MTVKSPFTARHLPRTVPGIILLCLNPLQSSFAGAEPVALKICTDYHCDVRQTVQLTDSHWRQLTKLFQTADSPDNERRAIREAIAYLEIVAGEQTETWRDLEENQGEGSEPGQLDCIAESINTTTYLNFLEEKNFLSRHRILPRQRRNPWFFDFHWSAAIQDIEQGQTYAVDSWFLKNGKPPVIQPLDQWLAGEKFMLDAQ